MLQVGIRPDNIMIAGNQQPDSVFRPPSHVNPNQQSAADPRSSIYNPTSVTTSIQTSQSSGFSRSVSSGPSRHPHHHSSHSSNSSQINSASTSQTLPFRPTGATPTSSSSPAVTSDSRQLSPSTTRRPSQSSSPQIQSIRLRDLSHVAEIAQDDARQQSRSPQRRNQRQEERRRYEISGMPVSDVIEMVARLLTKITTTNDRTHQDMHQTMAAQEGTNTLTGTTSSILAFHGKNIPAITIQSYLSRIHKYCPTSYEVFLSLLVYFDRMTEKVNQNIADWKQGQRTRKGSTAVDQSPQQPSSPISNHSGGPTITGYSASDAYNMSQFFVVDSFNIHRLVIAGVTCASKFFSDIFYTNSRYAKVGGLPLPELNHLELQFLLLNDFRLAVPVEELEAYGTMLVSFYAREAIVTTNLQGGITPAEPERPPRVGGGSSDRRRDGTGAPAASAAPAVAVHGA